MWRGAIVQVTLACAELPKAEGQYANRDMLALRAAPRRLRPTPLAYVEAILGLKAIHLLC